LCRRIEKIPENFARITAGLSSDESQAIQQLHEAYKSEATDFIRKNTNITLIELYNQREQDPIHQRRCNFLVF
jgi:hypothetical protein